MCINMKVLLLSVALLCVAEASKTCEKIQVTSCRDVGYNYTSMPNLARQVTQAEAELALRAMEPLFQVGCFPHMRLFACSVFVPMCAQGLAPHVGPCRGLCERTREACVPVLQGFGYHWPEDFDCDRFPHEADYEHTCIMGPM